MLPLVAIFVFGIIDLGRAYRLKTSLTNAAHEGAAYAQYNPSQIQGVGTCADPNNIVFAARHEEGTTSTFAVTVHHTDKADDPAIWNTPISACGSTGPRPARVIVTTSAPFALRTPIVSGLVGKTITLHQSSEVLVQ